jgi:hypothetical protein
MAMATAALAQPAPARPPHEQTPSVDPAASLARTAVESATVDAPAATLAFENRPIVEFRATVLSRKTAMRGAANESFL